MAVDVSRDIQEGAFGSIEPLTLIVLREEMEKLQGTLRDDATMNYEKCVFICDDFIDDLGKCINLSIEKYREDKECYDNVFFGLQEVINLIHRVSDGLMDSNGNPRNMDPQEARMAASDKVDEIMEYLANEIIVRDIARERAKTETATASQELASPKRQRPKDGAQA